ncbi:MAG: tripartite tricarboxylate transporter substrate binding protein [Burkholderiales bacterium]|nr:tripartite tricarboxylate transporter substrate binding protein [Burkholderiales bacterium]
MIVRNLAAVAALAFAASAGYAQDYPARAVTIVVPNPPGGMNQIHAQPLSVVWERITKQPAPVVNRPGATAALGTAFVVAQQPADGYTLLVSTGNMHLVIEKDKLYGAPTAYSLDQVEFLALLSADPIIMVAHPSLPVKTAKDVAALARSRPNEIVFSSSGVYGVTHAPLQLFLDAAKVKMRHLPTTGGGPALTQALGGHSQITSGGPAAVYQYVKSGKLRAIASYGVKSHPALPDLPLMKNSGYDIESYLWVGLFTRKGVPEPVLAKMRETIAKVAADPQFQQALRNVQVVPEYRDGPEFRKFFEADHKRMAAAIKSIGKL